MGRRDYYGDLRATAMEDIPQNAGVALCENHKVKRMCPQLADTFIGYARRAAKKGQEVIVRRTEPVIPISLNSQEEIRRARMGDLSLPIIHAAIYEVKPT